MSERILITNDDGIDAPGLRWLARAAPGRPRRRRRGAAHRGERQQRRDDRGRAGRQDRRRTAGAGRRAQRARLRGGRLPAFIVLLALREAFGAVPTMVLSGINRGANAGAAVVHSGTVGATLTASHAGLHGLAVSLDVLTPATATSASGGAAIARSDQADDEQRHWDSAADLAVRLLPTLTHTPAGTVLNLNVPDLHPDGIRGLRRARLARFGQVQMSIAEAGEGFVRTAVQAARRSWSRTPIWPRWPTASRW